MVIDSILQVNFIALQSSLTHLLLPSLALALGLIAIIHRTLRSSLLDILQEDYILTDRSKGLPEWYIFFVRAFKNGALPVLTIIGVQISFVIGGSVIIELIYGWPGIGTLSLISVNRRDLPVVQGIIVIYSLITIIINLAVDFLYTKLNPKITYG
jgi:ABC-type dipeptide/oligopeptide/nickel transport system permease component